MIEIISLVLNLILGSSLVLFYTQEKRRRNAEAAGSEHASESIAIKNATESAIEWKAIAEARETKLNRKDELIDRLYAEKAEDRKIIHEQEATISRLTIERNNALFVQCQRRRCDERTPPNELF